MQRRLFGVSGNRSSRDRLFIRLLVAGRIDVQDSATTRIDLHVLDLIAGGLDLLAVHEVAVLVIESDLEHRPRYLSQSGGIRPRHINPGQRSESGGFPPLSTLLVWHPDAGLIGRGLGFPFTFGMGAAEQRDAQCERAHYDAYPLLRLLAGHGRYSKVNRLLCKPASWIAVRGTSCR